MLDHFPTEESIRHVNGMQSEEMSCASFLRDEALGLLNDSALVNLERLRVAKNDVWTHRIAHELGVRRQKEADQGFGGYPPERIRDFLLSDGVFSPGDFFDEVYYELCDFREMVQNNRSREKKFFFSSDGKPKIENDCRDVVLKILSAKRGDEWELTPEGLEADNRVDINIRYRKFPEFEVQIECKRDSHPEILSGIPDQLFRKYMKADSLFGIYLVFFFGLKDKDSLLKNLEASIPDRLNARIKVVLIDVRMVD